MRIFSDLGVQTKLIGSFVLICLITASVGYIGVSVGRSTQSALDAVATDDLPGVIALARVQVAITRAQRDVRTVLLQEDPTQRGAQLDMAQGRLNELEKAWAEYRALNSSDAEAQLMPVFEATYRSWKPLMVRTLDELKKGTEAGDSAATEIVLKQMGDQTRSMNQTITGLTDANYQSAVEDVANSQRDRPAGEPGE